MMRFVFLTWENFSLICELVIALLGLVLTLYLATVHPDVTEKDKLDMALEIIINTSATTGNTVNADLFEKVIVYVQELRT